MIEDQKFHRCTSASLCTQDLILLTDFLSLSDIISLFCMGFSGGESDPKTIRQMYTNLLPIDRIEYLLLKQGKTDSDMLTLEQQLNMVIDFKKMATHMFSFEMSSLHLPMFSIDSGRLGSSFLD